MNKIQIKTSNEFHNAIKGTLDDIMSEKNIQTGHNYKKITGIAASIVLLLIISLLTANAMGLIDLHPAFIKRMDIEDDTSTKQLAELMSSPDLPEAVINGDYTLRLLHSANDAHSGIAMFELSSNKKDLHHEMYVPLLNVAVDGIQIDGSSAPSVHDKGVVSRLNLDDSIKQTINELKSFETEWNSIKNKSDEELRHEALSELEKHNKEFKKKYTNKYYFNLYFQSLENISGKNISFDIGGFALDKPNDDFEYISGNYYINKTFSISWKLASGTKELIVDFPEPVKIASHEFNSMSLNPLSMVLTSVKPLYTVITRTDEQGNTYEEIALKNNEEQEAFQDLINAVPYAVKYKNGKTEHIQVTGDSTNPNCIFSTFDRIIDFSNVQSIFIGNPITADTVVSENDNSLETIIQENQLVEIPLQ